MAEDMNREYGWEDEVENRLGFIDIPDGEYEFMVDHYERAKVGGDGKYAGQNMATVYCNILAGDGEEPQIRTNLILNKAFDWKLSQFFICIGLMKDEEGARLKMNWNQVGGRRGRCKVEHKPNYNDKTKEHLEITEFLKPAENNKKWGSGF
ncbi:MAG: hypothetical protein LUB60_06260 [Clostridiales bacterium]|nr:hypothetical protein [Clostridiales bacterium]